MRFLEFNNISLPITNEEQVILDHISKHGSVSKNSLSERDVHIANQLVNKSIIIRKRSDEQIIYKSRQSSQKS